MSGDGSPGEVSDKEVCPPVKPLPLADAEPRLVFRSIAISRPDRSICLFLIGYVAAGFWRRFRFDERDKNASYG